ncbi:MAG: aminotransferase class V-fold PLP-dependent enzyme, partial [Cytophagales bacterium]|nr:aminotransferase class V-fold PLP-dependent enzyme [Cytophagales bacterium]
GSCTMKLNAASELLPLSWKDMDIHPFVPHKQAQGYHALISDLTRQLQEITGLSAISFQPSSGAQGEYTGLLVIRAYLKSKGEADRDVILIPDSAHGTNPASAVLAGLDVKVLPSDSFGNIDFEVLKKMLRDYGKNLLGLMMTYPSTYGIFEKRVKDICELIHSHGGQVYMDGANMNAQIGLTSPGKIGVDVCHLNLHKTFCIPHGGGGPGMGPIAVANHLAPYLPGHSLVRTGGRHAIRAVSSAPFGSASLLGIPYAYISMMGTEGLRRSAERAILHANYLKDKLKVDYPILHVGKGGRCAHEFIIDCRPFKDANVMVEDIAKRLADYGFHAPTISFPVPETLMIEPTESENLSELDRFCEAMQGIRKEIEEIRKGKADKTDNLLKNAPHTLSMLLSDNWSHPYSREQAAFPVSGLRKRKLWPSVARVDNALGDRNLICTCPSLQKL